MKNKKKPFKGGDGKKGFVTEYRNRYTGRLMKASDYGYAAWPLGKKKG